MELYHLIEVLEKSVEKHGETPLTNKWLLNILKVAERKALREDHIPFYEWDDNPF